MITVCIESPLRGDITRNVRYADACMLDSLKRGEAPFLGHLLYPRVLDDDIDEHRAWGIDAHVAWLRRAELVAVYEDLGVTQGMGTAIAVAHAFGIAIAHRKLGEHWPLLLTQARPTAGHMRGIR